LRRIHLFEFEDHPWCPQSLRDTITDGIRFALDISNIYAPIASLLDRAIKRSKATRIVDLGSGAGGPWRKLKPMLNVSSPVWLTDLRPNAKALRKVSGQSKGEIRYIEEPVDATKGSLPDGFLTIFNSYHHFKPPMARMILENAFRARQGIGIFEVTGGNPISILSVFAVPILMILCGVIIQPFRISRLFWTYIIPAAPIIGLIDGLVSCLRVYSTREELSLIKGLDSGDYFWRIGIERTRVIRAPITFLIGYPLQSGRLIGPSNLASATLKSWSNERAKSDEP
jgi:hypothetical protein